MYPVIQPQKLKKKKNLYIYATINKNYILGEWSSLVGQKADENGNCSPNNRHFQGNWNIQTIP